MSMWFSEFHVRTLAERIAPKMAPKVEAAVLSTVRAELPALLMAELRDLLPEHTPKRSVSARRDRNAAICARYNGRNIKELAAEFKLSRQSIWTIVGGGKR